jgi:HD-like signal output (HDOD) protein/CheY-like chemotaxis protein
LKSVLFVDDEPYILDALRRLMSNMSGEWRMRFAGSGAEALRLLQEGPSDVVVTDMRMPQMNGAQLLNEVVRLHPKTVRIILSGYCDAEMVAQCIKGTHQFLSKPCSSETMKGVIRRALDMDGWINNDTIKSLVSGLDRLPSMPSVYFEIMAELEAESGTIERAGEIISRDPAMAAKILQLVNSAFFGLRREISDPGEAVMQLGVETIRSLALCIHVFSEMKTSGSAAVAAQKLWNHSMATAARCRSLAKAEHLDRESAEASFTAGLLHDVGRLVILGNLPDACAEAERLSETGDISIIEAEEKVLGVNHAAIGGYLLGLWGLPVPLVEAAVFHHTPGLCKTETVTPLGIVHVANVLEHENTSGEPAALMPHLDEDYLKRIGLWEHVPAFRKTESPAIKA